MVVDQPVAPVTSHLPLDPSVFRPLRNEEDDEEEGSPTPPKARKATGNTSATSVPLPTKEVLGALPPGPLRYHQAFYNGLASGQTDPLVLARKGFKVIAVVGARGVGKSKLVAAYTRTRFVANNDPNYDAADYEAARATETAAFGYPVVFVELDEKVLKISAGQLSISMDNILVTPDFILNVYTSRFTETNAAWAKAAHVSNVPMMLIRTQIEGAISSEEENIPGYDEDDPHANRSPAVASVRLKIRNNLEKDFRRANLPVPKCFLVDSNTARASWVELRSRRLDTDEVKLFDELVQLL